MTLGKRVIGGAWPTYGHMVPTLNLALRFRAAGHQVCMLNSAIAGKTPMEPLLGNYDLEQISVPSHETDIEAVGETLALLRTYRPDMTICDFHSDLWVALQIHKVSCRISILRRETLAADEQSSKQPPNVFLSDASIRRLSEVSRQFGGPVIKNVSDLVRSDIVVVPSVQELDPLPAGIEKHYPNTIFIYSGPLFLPIAEPVAEEVRHWIAERRRQNRRIVLVTLGTLSGTLPRLPDSQLIAKLYLSMAASFKGTGFAVLMVVPEDTEAESLRTSCGPDLYVTGLTDVHELAMSADVVIHHGGHGTLQAVLLAGKPSVTLTTQSHARDEYSHRLERLSCSKYLRGQFFPNIPTGLLSAAVKEVMHSSAIQDGVARISTILREQMRIAPAQIGQALERHWARNPELKSLSSM